MTDRMHIVRSVIYFKTPLSIYSVPCFPLNYWPKADMNSFMYMYITLFIFVYHEITSDVEILYKMEWLQINRLTAFKSLLWFISLNYLKVYLRSQQKKDYFLSISIIILKWGVWLSRTPTLHIKSWVFFPCRNLRLDKRYIQIRCCYFLS